MRAIRGAITVEDNKKEMIKKASRELIKKIIEKNNLKENEIISIIFTVTSDLDKVYPAVVVREMGYTETPLMCYQEMEVKDSLDKCIRAMVYIDRDERLDKIVHIYLKKARSLRPDLLN